MPNINIHTGRRAANKEFFKNLLLKLWHKIETCLNSKFHTILCLDTLTVLCYILTLYASLFEGIFHAKITSRLSKWRGGTWELHIPHIPYSVWIHPSNTLKTSRSMTMKFSPGVNFYRDMKVEKIAMLCLVSKVQTKV